MLSTVVSATMTVGLPSNSRTRHRRKVADQPSLTASLTVVHIDWLFWFIPHLLVASRVGKVAADKQHDDGEKNPSGTVHPLARLTKELRALRKGVGLTRQKVEASPYLMETLQVRRPSDTWGFLQEALLEVSQTEDGRALANAYAVGLRAPGNLTERRSDYAIRISRHADTVEARENAAARAMAAALLAHDAGLAGSIHVWARVENERLRSYRVFRVPVGGDASAAIRGDARAAAELIVAAHDFVGEAPTPQFVTFVTPSDTDLSMLQISVWFRTGPKPAAIWCTMGHSFPDLVECRYGRHELQWMSTDDRRAAVVFDTLPRNVSVFVMWRFSEPGPTLESASAESGLGPARPHPVAGDAE